MKKLTWSASVMCADLGHLEEQFKTLEACGCHELHLDIMDGDFVPNLTLGFEFISLAKRVCGLPCDVHLMVERPERYIARAVDAGAATISIHVEASTHVHRALQQIRDAGASPCIAINPATPLTKLEYLLPSADRILVMTVDPGYAGQTILRGSFERVKILRENLDYSKNRAKIQVDGNIDVRNAALLAKHGAEVFVLGSSSIFHGIDVAANFAAFSSAVMRECSLA